MRLVLIMTVGLFGIIASAVELAAQCSGDCNGDRRVTVDELVRGVNIALGTANVSLCNQLDTNDDGRVTVSELVSAVAKSLAGCDSTPIPRTPTPTATAASVATATPIGVPGCNNGVVEGSFSNVSGTNADTSAATLTLVAASQPRDPRSGRYLWGITGNTCDASDFARSIQIQVIGPVTGFAVGSHPLTPPLGSLVYVESPTSSIQPRIWNTTGTTLVIDSVDGGLTFHIDDAPMVPNLIVAGNPPPMGTFNLSVAGTIDALTGN